jgi:hypothetical protein
VTRRPSSLLGVPRDRFPRLIGVWGALTSYRPSRLASVVPRLRGTTLCPLVRSGGCGALLPSARRFIPGVLLSPLLRGNDRTSQVPGVPLWKRAVLSSDSGGPTLPCHISSGSMLSCGYLQTLDPTTTYISELNRTARSLAVYASRPASRPGLVQDSLLVRWLRFDQAGLPPAGHRTRLSRWHRFLPSCRARLVLAHIGIGAARHAGRTVPPHRSGRADFLHPAPRVTGSLRAVAQVGVRGAGRVRAAVEAAE